MKRTCVLVLLIGVLAGLFVDSVLASKKNVLFLMADDFNHWLGGIGYYDGAITPNLDKLAAKGVLFTDAQNASPVCNPSRNAIWSGLRPVTTGIMSNGDGYVREKKGLENIVSMHQYFMQNGYYAYGAGKLWHSGKMGGRTTDAKNWSGLYRGGTGSPGGSYSRFNSNMKGYSWSGGEFDLGKQANDTVMANHIAKFISEYSKSEKAAKPFFIGCGFFRPHLPWNCHKKFWDLYDRDKIEIPKGYIEGDLDDIKRSPNGRDIHLTLLKENKWKEGIHAYLANLSFADYNVGIVLEALEKSPYKDNTIVLFMGDHGWHLGEKERWSKHEVFDQANRTTLIIYDPSAKGNGRKCHKVVCLQDLYPTLVSLCGLDENLNVQGNDISPLLAEPDMASWDKPVFISYRGTHYIKTNKWKFIDEGDRSQLYDVVNDPYEWKNLYGDSKYDAAVGKLKGQMAEVVRESEELRKRVSKSGK